MGRYLKLVYCWTEEQPGRLAFHETFVEAEDDAKALASAERQFPGFAHYEIVKNPEKRDLEDH